eukprot:CAMPEP_0119105862 /NCGR_PEP_ID=MMETSP1180-20130426/3720_1 /TAXON_ID=3052 ORGANISM="Chlamydomonas cf sp, Strain CCMP681" /NCGR_SAMPLE_ID=MMETSP1180 /ASSEMBLY_ACC=CAM_ASM_000741 /LENGTH=367 /DNA_ID=CAMNT_0007091035 /DNA_START=169 /DNA_END=1272 /DNA_ORIENTATION=+
MTHTALNMAAAASTWPMHSFVDVSGQPTEVLHAPADAQLPSLQILVLPGNPGSAHYYKDFMRQLHTAFKGQAHIYSCSHAGHDTGPHNTGKQTLKTLDEQITHKADFMRQHLLLPGRPPLVILAHSIGAYMAVKAVARLESEVTCAPYTVVQMTPTGAELDSNGKKHLLDHLLVDVIRPPILQVVALMPYFQADFGNTRQRHVRAVANRYNVMRVVAQVLAWLPLWLRVAAVGTFTGSKMSEEAVLTTCELLQPASIRQNFYMAKTEFEQLDEPFNWKLLGNLGQRARVLACPNDDWMSQTQYKHMLTRVPGLQTSWVTPGLEHAFCTNSEQCATVVGHVKAGLESAEAGLDSEVPTVGRVAIASKL